MWKLCTSIGKQINCADALARIGCSLEHDMIIYDDCPAAIRDILLADELGMTTPRLIVARFLFLS
jgi:hypothetical protein